MFINAEYCLLLDSDTIVTKQFDLLDFGLDISPGLAFSNECNEKDLKPTNTGVALFNVPKLRETFEDFFNFIRKHVDGKKDFHLGPSDQGAYLDYYHIYKNEKCAKNMLKNPDYSDYSDRAPSKYIQFLYMTFNVKPYHLN